MRLFGSKHRIISCIHFSQILRKQILNNYQLLITLSFWGKKLGVIFKSLAANNFIPVLRKCYFYILTKPLRTIPLGIISLRKSTSELYIQSSKKASYKKDLFRVYIQRIYRAFRVTSLEKNPIRENLLGASINTRKYIAPKEKSHKEKVNQELL